MGSRAQVERSTSACGAGASATDMSAALLAHREQPIMKTVEGLASGLYHCIRVELGRERENRLAEGLPHACGSLAVGAEKRVTAAAGEPQRRLDVPRDDLPAERRPLEDVHAAQYVGGRG